MRYRIEVTSENPLGDLLVENAAQQLAIALDDATNQGSVLVVNAETGVWGSAYRFPADDPPPEPDLDAQAEAAWTRYREAAAELATLALRSIAATVLGKYPTAASLPVRIRHPDEVGLPDSYQVDQDDELLDTDGQPIEGADLAELDDLVGEDLLTLAEMDEVYSEITIDLRADPPDFMVTDHPANPPTVPVQKDEAVEADPGWTGEEAFDSTAGATDAP